ncbi:hypothetical protein BC629DRAFT_1590251 [Irpex lacteus]|nr:hypothetical protein BC629DRAFT_1590251 [Irpex lacteus]
MVLVRYFTRTCYYLLVGKKLQKPVVAVLIIPIACHLAFGIDTVVHIAHMKTMLDIEPFRMSSAVPMLSFQVAADVLVSVALCLSLPRPSLMNERTRVAVQELIIYTVSRGIITTAAAVVELVALAAVPDSTWFIAVEYIVACLYINSFLASLNTRKRLRRRLTGYTSTHPASSAPIPLGLCRPRIRESRGDVGGEDATVVSPHRVQADVFTIPKYDGAEDYKVSF